MKRQVAISALCHFLLLALLLLGAAGGKGKGKKDGKGNGHEGGKFIAKEKESTVEVDVVNPGDIPSLKNFKPKKKAPKHECKSSYGGIGVTFGYGVMVDGRTSMVVSEVAQGYPADEAGIVAGDSIDSEVEIRGEAGTEVTIKVTHANGTSEQVTLVRDNVCYEFDRSKRP